MPEPDAGAVPPETSILRAAPKTNGPWLLSLRDPNGYEITLDVETWEQHVHVEHPEMTLEDITRAVREPELIQRELGSPNSFYYYRLRGRAFYRRNDVYILVVVHRQDDSKSGVIRTAHLVKELRRKGGEIVWLNRK
jgi:hypothetical protein